MIPIAGKQVKLLLSHQSEAPYISQNLIGPTAGNLTDTIITNVVPADFNGDVQMDILLCRQKANDKSAPFYAEIYWGNGRFVDQGEIYSFSSIQIIFVCLSRL